MRPPSLFGREPSVAALAGVLVVVLVGGGAMASAVVGPGPAPQQNRTVTPTPTPTPGVTDTPTAAPTPTDTPAMTVPAKPATATDTPTAGVTDTPTEPVTVTPSPTPDLNTEPPDARFALAYGSGTVGQESEFLAESADGGDPGGQIVRYEWDFGDGSTATGQNVTHTFDSTGTYNVTLTVTSSDMLTDTVSKRVTIIEDHEPNVILWYEPDIPVEGWDIRFDVDVLNVDGDVASYEWDFGDGTTATQKSVQHAFESGGTYNVTLTVTTDDGQTLTDTRDVEVENSDYLPRAGICHESVGFDVGEEIWFRPTSSPTGYPTQTYEWDFGDGTTSTEESPTHAYDSIGTYTVTLTATNDRGGEKTTTTQVQVGPTGSDCTGESP